MAGRERDWDDNEGSPDPETLYTKEFCIGSFCHMSSAARSLQGTLEEEALRKKRKKKIKEIQVIDTPRYWSIALTLS